MLFIAIGCFVAYSLMYIRCLVIDDLNEDLTGKAISTILFVPVIIMAMYIIVTSWGR